MKAFDETWEEIHKNRGWGKYPSETVIRFVARNYYKIVPRSSVRILDFGCGGGAHTWYLAKEGFDTYAFDGSESAINNTKIYLEKEGLSADLRVLDGINIDYDNEYFDAVIDNVCIYANTLENIKAMYREAYRVLKQEGRIFTSVFASETLGYGTGELLEMNTYRNITEGKLAGRGIVHFFDNEEIRQILMEVGFKNLVVDSFTYEDCGSFVSMYIVGNC